MSNVSGIVFSPDGTILATWSWDNTIRLWNVATGVSFRTLEGHTSNITSIAFSPDGLILASGGWRDGLRLWNPTTGVYLCIH